jgi:hypothetical protein
MCVCLRQDNADATRSGLLCATNRWSEVWSRSFNRCSLSAAFAAGDVSSRQKRAPRLLDRRRATIREQVARWKAYQPPSASIAQDETVAQRITMEEAPNALEFVATVSELTKARAQPAAATSAKASSN